MVIGKRLSFYRRYPTYFSLTLIQSRPLKSLLALLKHTDYWTLTLLRTRSERNQLPAYLSFSGNTIACNGRNTKTGYKAEENFIWRHNIIFRIVYIWNAVNNHQLRAILPVLPAEEYVGLRNAILWLLFSLHNVEISHAPLILDKNIRHIIWRLSYIFNAISPICKTHTKN